MKNRWLLLLSAVALFSSCSVQRSFQKKANATILADSSLKHAHIGLAVYDPEAGSYLYQYNSDKYFIPASNIKIVTCFTAMQLLKDSIPGIQYRSGSDGLTLIPTGDPSFLHPDFKNQPVIDFLKRQPQQLKIVSNSFKTTPFGMGWSWDDYNEDYQPERSALPVYGNVVTWVQERDTADSTAGPTIYSIPEVNWKLKFKPDLTTKKFYVERAKDANVFNVTEGKEPKASQQVPFVTNQLEAALELLKDTVTTEFNLVETDSMVKATGTVYSQPLDSLLKPMMHRSDNFFAEQLLLMASQQKLGYFSESEIIDYVLKNNLKILPQRPRWVDGSGLSRYNLFTPQDFVTILSQMKKEYDVKRLQAIFPGAGQGTLSGLYKNAAGSVYAKTGTLSGVVALSGFVTTSKGKTLIFSFLVNNHRTSASAVRKQFENFLSEIIANN
ncbi:MAG: D-alanyl-D-alanine carboxypeptidase/D-alanyl-D-alanine-endopeptidase [Chitinophagaceae bacterium]|nr:D-alanyl-D-alanine carboxypeptidase/D-alanyl-D-alanine-endopeptidase [Chitinophagaceae bacterium]